MTDFADCEGQFEDYEGQLIDYEEDKDIDEIEDDDDDVWDGDGEESPEENQCLFCDQIFPSVDEVFAHCEKEHFFNIIDIGRKWKLDCIQYIKMINYIRSKVKLAVLIIHCLNRLTKKKKFFKFLKSSSSSENVLCSIQRKRLEIWGVCK